MTTEKTPELKVGQRVSVTSGPREGREGEIMECVTRETDDVENILNGDTGMYEDVAVYEHKYYVAIDGRSLEWINQEYLSVMDVANGK